MSKKSKKIETKGNIVIYQTPDKKVKIDVNLDQDTVWLNLNQLAFLFETDKSGISRHIKNIFKDRELDDRATVAKFATVQKEGKREVERLVEFYNLDVILSVGYRVNSKKATAFRVWATKILKDYLVKGYAINEKRLAEADSKFNELKSAIDLLQEKSGHELMRGQEQEILNLLADYSKTLTLLEQYDKEKVTLVKQGKGEFVLDYTMAMDVIKTIKQELTTKNEAGEFFGVGNSEKFKGILGNLYQTFDKKELYSSLEEKAAHLLYFVIKDHPFVDGNKRIGSFLFMYFLDKNNYMDKESGEKKINDNALTALALLIAVSDRNEKDKLVKIVTNLVK